MTIKQSKFLKSYVETGNATEAAMGVYDCKNRDTARAIGSENLAKLNIGGILDGLGLTNERIAGIVIEGTMHENPFVRYKYLELAIKLKGLFEIAKKSSDSSPDTLNDLFALIEKEKKVD